MSKRSIVRSGLLAGVLLFAATPAAPVLAAAPTSQWQPFEQEALNFCNGETVQVTGRQKVNISFLTDARGALHVVDQELVQGTGVGLTTGAKYIFNVTSPFHLNDFGTGFTRTSQIIEKLSSITKGVPDFFFRAQQRITVVGSSRVDLQACKLEYSIVSPK